MVYRLRRAETGGEDLNIRETVRLRNPLGVKVVRPEKEDGFMTGFQENV